MIKSIKKKEIKNRAQLTQKQNNQQVKKQNFKNAYNYLALKRKKEKNAQFIKKNKSKLEEKSKKSRSNKKCVKPSPPLFLFFTTELFADIATRGLTPAALTKYEIWWLGSDWMGKNESQWPLHSDTLSIASGASLTTVHTHGCIIDYTVTKSWQRLCRIGEKIILFIQAFDRKFTTLPNNEATQHDCRAWIETFLLFQAQKNLTDVEIKQRRLVKDGKGLWKTAGRLSLLHHVPPVFLNCQHPLTETLILKAHQECNHFSTSACLAEFLNIAFL